MSTLRRHRPVEACAGAARSACIAWDASPEALRQGGQPLPAGAIGASIRWEIEGDEARCVLEAAAMRRALETGRAAWSLDAGTGLWVLNVIGEGGEEILSAVLREGGPAGGRVLYARTSVLGRLGLVGGTYDVPVARSL